MKFNLFTVMIVGISIALGIVLGNLCFWRKDNLAVSWKRVLRVLAPFILVVFPPAFTYFYLIGTLSVLWALAAIFVFRLDPEWVTAGFHPIEWLCGILCLPAFYGLFSWLRLADHWFWILLASFVFTAGYRDARTEIEGESGPFVRDDFLFTDAIAPILAFLGCKLFLFWMTRRANRIGPASGSQPIRLE